MNKKTQKIVTIIFAILIFLLIVSLSIVVFNLRPVNVNDETYIEFEIPSGTGKGVIADKLEEADLIKSSFYLKVYMFITKPTLYAGTYKVSPSMTAIEILEKIESEESLEK